MQEEIKEQETTQEDYDVVAEVNKIKETMIDKAAYDKIKAERDKYCKALVEGTKVDDKQAMPIADLRNKLFNSELSNLEYAETALELREAILNDSKGNTDIFVGRGSKFQPDSNDFQKAQQVADAFQYCIDIADGDSDIFTRELMRITNDVNLPKKKRR